MDYLNSVRESAFVAEIDSNAASITVRTVGASKRFVVYYVFIQAEGAGSVQFQSGSTDLSGPINFAANEEREFNANMILLKGVDASDNFVIANAGTVQLNGWAVLDELDAV